VWWKFLPPFFYSLSVFIWFKDSFAPLRGLPFSHLLALIPFSAALVLLLARLAPWKKWRMPRRITKETAALLALLLIAVAVRIPFLASPYGLMTSDDAIPALMGKHIAEGKVPPICYYGQLYMGSLSSHFFALVFLVFGYSILVLKCATLLIYLSFITLLFFFLKRIFSFPFASAVTLFYALPVTELINLSFDNTSAFGLVLLSGAVMLYFAHLISFESREKLLPALGFVMGLAFWTHPITVSFILTAFLILVFKFKLRVRKYVALFFFAFLGFLPQLLIEVSHRFQLAVYLTSGERAINWAKLKSSFDFIVSLLSSSGHPTRNVFLLFLLCGFLYLFFLSLKKRAFLPPAVFCLHLFLFIVLYVTSYFSGKPVIRYLYPLYVSVPVVMLAAFLPFRLKWRKFPPFALVLILFFFYNLKGTQQFFGLNRERHHRISRVITAMEETGRRYWLADYWTAYLLTCVSKERLIVESHTFRRYPPYTLAYWNQSEKDNYVFLLKDEPEEAAGYRNVGGWIQKLGLRAEQKDVETCHLVYDIEYRFYPRALVNEPPARIPDLELESTQPRPGYVRLSFRNVSPGGNVGFWLNAEIPGYSHRKVWFLSSQPRVTVELPIPRESSITVSYYLDYVGIRIPSSARELLYLPPSGVEAGRPDSVVPLLGLGPDVSYDNRNRTICRKEVRLEINPPSAHSATLRLHLYSPFGFSQMYWYGKFAQSVRIEVNDVSLEERELKDGASVISLSVPRDLLRARDNVVSLKFRHQQWLSGLPPGMTAAFLDKIEIF